MWAWPKNGCGCEYKNWARVYKISKFSGEQNAEVRIDLANKANDILCMGIWPCAIGITCLIL